MKKALRPIALASCVLVSSFAHPIHAQTATNKNLNAYGSRVGDREIDPESGKLSNSRRTNLRLNTRIDNRLDTRLDRFDVPDKDNGTAKAPNVDDGTKNSSAR